MDGVSDAADDEPVLDDEQIALLSTVSEKLEAEAARLGLYMKGSQPVIMHGPLGPEPGLVVNFLIGDLAWSDRVQDPQADADADVLAEMEHHDVKERFEQLRRKARGELEHPDEPDS